jgi:hypothetical protein
MFFEYQSFVCNNLFEVYTLFSHLYLGCEVSMFQQNSCRVRLYASRIALSTGSLYSAFATVVKIIKK